MAWWIWLIVIIIIIIVIISLITAMGGGADPITSIGITKLNRQAAKGTMIKTTVPRSKGGRYHEHHFGNKTNKPLPLTYTAVSHSKDAFGKHRCSIDYLKDVTVAPKTHVVIKGKEMCDVIVWSHPDLTRTYVK